MKTLYGLREPSFKNMMDPSWLPSAIMQTSAALIGICVVVYVFVVQALIGRGGTTHLIYKKEGLKIELTPVLNGFLIILVLAGILTILFNVLWLDYLTVGAYCAYSDSMGKLLQWLSTRFFLISLLLIFIYSCLLIYTAKGI
ncbi:MAG: hypothetical protein U9O85_07450 [Euryarchaeota archaeon]|nr:hypothetical protein [Euryarchaeota archaeon]